MDNILIADSGSTKTDWAFGQTIIKTQGINPFHQDDEAILSILRDELLPQLTPLLFPPPTGGVRGGLLTSSPVGEGSGVRLSIHFYGAGVRPELEDKMERLLRQVFPQAETIEAKSDMLGAARALCHDTEGLACILGTGANSCLYDGRQIVANISPLGYILGDEGSGAVLGRLFLNALYKKRLYAGAREEFEGHFGLTMADVIERVYRQPMANRWLASLSAYIHQHLDQSTVHNLVVKNFRDFIRHNIQPYQRPDLPINAVGSIAWYYQQQLAEAATAEGYAIGTILRSPIDGLI